MSDFGVCRSDAGHCSLSFERVSLDGLFSHINALERHRAAGNNADIETPLLKPFLVFFQSSATCSCCNGELARTTQPKAEKLNQVLNARDRLQSLEVLPF
jgi:hypothetical protein